MQEFKRKKNEPKQFEKRKCSWCGTEFWPVRKWQEFCRSICRWKDWDKKNPRQNIEALKEASKALSIGKKKKKHILIVVSFLIFLICSTASAQPDFNKLVDAIYLAEGGSKARVPFGILSVPCKNYSDCRQVAYRTVVNNYRRWQASDQSKTYLVFLRDRYAPLSDSELNKNWLKNVTYFMERL